MAKRKNKGGNKVVTGVILTLVAAGVVGGAAAITKGFTEAPRVGFVDKLTSKNKIYSVEFENGKAKGTRMDAAEGLVAGINGERNDFDNIYPYSEMKTVTDEYGNKFIDIPKFFEKIDITEDGVKYSITGKETKGFHVAPMFIQGEEVVEHVQIGAYEASFANSGRDLASVSGAAVAGSITLDEARTLAAHHGNTLFDWRQNQGLQTLFSVEFATLDSQSVMRGITEYSCVYLESQSNTNKKKFDVSQDEIILFEDTKLKDLLDTNPNVYIYYSGDDSVYIDNANLQEYKLDSNDNITSITLDKELNLTKIEEKIEDLGMEFDSNCLYFDINGVAMTGLTDGKKGSSVGDAKHATAMNYRGIENWYGSSWTWIDGIATIKEGEKDMICVSMETSKNGNRDSYKRIEKRNIVNAVTSEGLYLANHSEEAEGGDYFNTSMSSDYCIGYVGGGYCNGVNAGAFYLNLYDGVSYAYYYYGFRLSYIPQ